MNDRRKCELTMLIRVDQFCEEHLLEEESAVVSQHRAEVADAKNAMIAKGGQRELGRGEFRAGALERRIVAKDLRRQMREIAETAKVLGKMPEYAGIELQFRMPKHAFQDLRDRAEAFIAAATPIQQAFIDRESPATFVADLTEALAAFDAATERRYAGLGSQVGATAGLASDAKKGIAAVRALNAILTKRYRNNPDLLAEWRAAQRIPDWPSLPSPQPEPEGSPSES